LGKRDKFPSPCIDICKDKRGVCVGCGRTKKQKKAWKDAGSDAAREALILQCAEAARDLGIYDFWAGEYRRKCHKKGRECPIDHLMAEAADT
jgi:predicted Fe-S protein YdhL (DUF1289 family)